MVGAGAVMTIAAVASGTAYATSGAAPGRAAADPVGTPLVRETFTGATAPEFTGYNDACLTGAPAGAPAQGEHPLGGCTSAETGPVPPLDAAPHGYLRLTDAGLHGSGAALFNQAIPATAGLDVTFDSWQYGSDPVGSVPADGISFFLVNGDVHLTAPGAFGGSLGYAKSQDEPETDPTKPFMDGVAGGYLGVGLDVFGNFFADTEQRGHGCEGMRSPAGQPWQDSNYYDRGPNMVTLRGPGNGIEGYCYITATTDFPHSDSPVKPWPSNLPGSLQGSTTSLPADVTPAEAEALLDVDRRRVNVRITPVPDPRVIVTVDFNNGTGPHQVLDVPAPTPVPPTYKFGFAASTGNFDDVHLIRNVAINSDQPLPRLDLVKQVTEPRPGHLTVGDQVHYQYTVTNSGTTPITGLVVHDNVVSPVTCPVTTLEPGETVTCTGTHIVTAADVARGFIENTAVATGEADGVPVISPPSSERVDITEPPGIDLEKLVDTPGPFFAGKEVRYSYLVTNTGGVTLNDVRVTDDHVRNITCAATMLAPAGRPGDSTTCTGTYVITKADVFNGMVINTAVASGVAPDGQTITSPPAQQTILVGRQPRLTLRKLVGPGPHSVGITAWYKYVITNTGSVTLHNVSVIDNRAAHITCGPTTLWPGQSTVCFGTYRITKQDGKAGRVTNTAQASGVDSRGVMWTSNFATATFQVQ
jgi:hypothetical protein